MKQALSVIRVGEEKDMVIQDSKPKKNVYRNA
jgi:hypothetical protein